MSHNQDATALQLRTYRGRIAPTPTGLLHLGHARTFWVAAQRARERGGTLVLRIEDLDRARCRAEFTAAAIEDLHWLGIDWQEGPDLGGDCGPYTQSERLASYADVWRQLHATGLLYPSPHSRADVARSLSAPHEEDDAEPIFPASLRPDPTEGATATSPGAVNWRFRVPDGRAISFVDGNVGVVTRTAGVDFGDFIVWRKDGFPAYELAVVADDLAMGITEVVRGEDLLTSTARQLLLYEALGSAAPAFFHCPLVHGADGKRLAKRAGALSLRAQRERGITAEQICGGWQLPDIIN